MYKPCVMEPVLRTRFVSGVFNLITVTWYLPANSTFEYLPFSIFTHRNELLSLLGLLAWLRCNKPAIRNIVYSGISRCKHQTKYAYIIVNWAHSISSLRVNEPYLYFFSYLVSGYFSWLCFHHSGPLLVRYYRSAPLELVNRLKPTCDIFISKYSFISQ